MLYDAAGKQFLVETIYTNRLPKETERFLWQPIFIVCFPVVCRLLLPFDSAAELFYNSNGFTSKEK